MTKSNIDVYWGSGSPFAWTALLALEFKGLPYESHVLEFSKKEHKSPEIMKMNPRGKVPVLKDGDFCVYESQAILHYLDKKYPEKPLFGRTPEDTAKIMQTISEISSYAQKPMGDTVRPFLMPNSEIKEDDIRKSGETARQELADFNSRLQKTPWLAGSSITAADLTFYPFVRLFIRGWEKDASKKYDMGFMPFAEKFPAIASWMKKVEGLPGFEKTFPPHWKTK